MMTKKIVLIVSAFTMATIAMVNVTSNLKAVPKVASHETKLVITNQETVVKAVPRRMKLMIASFGTINSQAEVENWLGDQLRPNENTEQPLTLSEADKIANTKMAAAVVRVNWNTKKLEYIRTSNEIQRENARRMKILTNLKTSMLSEESQRYTQLGREYLQSRLFKKAGRLIKVVDRGNMTIQQTEKAIKGRDADIQNGADCILSVVMGDREEDSKTIPIDNVGTKIKRTTYTAPYVGKIRDLDGNVLLSFDGTAEWRSTQNNVVKSQNSDPVRKLMEVVCDKIADEVVAYFTTKLSFKVRVPKGMDEDDVEIYVDGREVDFDGKRVLAFEHIVKASLEGCKTVRKIVEIENGESEKIVKLKLKAKNSKASSDCGNDKTETISFDNSKNNKKLEVSPSVSNIKCGASKRHSQARPIGGKVQKKVEFAKENSHVAEQLQKCDFLLNKNFKKNAKVYLCLFSASWCPPCRREMPRIARIYEGKLKFDPDIELIHFSRDKDEGKALAWAKEHDIKFPIVKCSGGNPLNLHTRGIPHLFIVKADGTVLEHGHPVKLFTEGKLRELKANNLIAVEKKPLSDSCKISDNASSSFYEKDYVVNKSLVDGVEWWYKIEDGEAWIDNATSSNAVDQITIPSTLGGYPVTKIGRTIRRGVGHVVFLGNCRNMRSLTVPSPMTRIMDGVFFYCTNLTSVSISESVTHISRRAFLNNGELISFVVDDKNEKYSSRNGLLCSKEGDTLIKGVNREVTIPKSVTVIGDSAFSDCHGLKSVVIPESVTKIGNYAFYGCCSLKSVLIPESVTNIGYRAFSGCADLISFSVDTNNPLYSSRNGLLCTKDGTMICAGVNGHVTIPNGVKSIGSGAFWGCTGLKLEDIPKEVTSIGYKAFFKTLFYDNLPEGLVVLGGGVLYAYKGECPSSVTIPNGVTVIGDSVFSDCHDLKSVVIPESVASIGYSAFSECCNLKSVVIPKSVTKIGSRAFKGCRSLKSVIIPDSVTSIGHSAFELCSGLEVVTVPYSITNIVSQVFKKVNNLKTINVVKDGKIETMPFDSFREEERKENLKRIERFRQFQKLRLEEAERNRKLKCSKECRSQKSKDKKDLEDCKRSSSVK